MIRYTPEARADVDRLYAWRLVYNSADLAERFLQLLVQTEERIAARPLLYPPSAGGEARKCLMRLGRHVYVLHYIIDGDDQVIVRIWHGSENRV